jgi:hypothetical protein
LKHIQKNAKYFKICTIYHYFIILFITNIDLHLIFIFALHLFRFMLPFFLKLLINLIFLKFAFNYYFQLLENFVF